MFDSPVTQSVLRYIRETYGDEPEFPFAKLQDNAVFRHRENKKWYALLIDLPRRRLGLPEEGNTDVLNLKCDARVGGALLDGKRYFPGYHMNKEHWITLLLDGSIPEEELHAMVDLSYQLTKGRLKPAGRGRGQSDE